MAIDRSDRPLDLLIGALAVGMVDNGYNHGGDPPSLDTLPVFRNNRSKTVR